MELAQESNLNKKNVLFIIYYLFSIYYYLFICYFFK